MMKWFWTILLSGILAAPVYAQNVVGSGIIGDVKRAAGGSTWNPADKSANVTLSGGNLVATVHTGAFSNVRSTSSYAEGTNHKVVFLITTIVNDGGWFGGVANAATSLTAQLGTTGNSYGFWIGQGGFGNNVGTVQGCGGSTTVTFYVAVDFNTGNLWCSADCTTWIGAGPSGGAGGDTSAILPAGTYFATWGGFQQSTGDAGTFNPAPSLGGCSDLTGFTTWN